MTKMMNRYSLVVLAVMAGSATAFSPVPAGNLGRPSTALSEQKEGGLFGAIGGFFEELDAFVDDATSRRLGAGSAFYGKRKSGFYGKEDKGKKSDRNMPDPTEDYQGM